MRNVYPGSQVLNFTRPGSRIQQQQQHKRSWENLFSNYLFLYPHISQNWKLSYFWTGKGKHLSQLTKRWPKTFVTNLSEIWVGGPRSGIRKKTYPVSWIQGSVPSVDYFPFPPFPIRQSLYSTFYFMVRFSHLALLSSYLSPAILFCLPTVSLLHSSFLSKEAASATTR